MLRPVVLRPAGRPHAGLHLGDLCWLVYLTSGALLLAAWQGPAWPVRTVLYLAGCAAIVWMAGHAARDGAARVWRVVAALYPVALVGLSWGELRVLIPLPWDGRYWVTDWLVRSDLRLFGGHPTVLVQSLHRPWLDEALAAVYVSYYLLLAVPLALVLLRRDAAARAAGSLIALTYTVNFALFVLLPGKSPPQVVGDYAGLRASAFGGYAIADLLRAVQGSESVTGGAFPSSHVAGALVCALAARRWAPALGRALLPLAGGIAVATVYLGYHHAIDPIAGLAWGAAAYAGGLHLLGRRGELPAPPHPTPATERPDGELEA